MTYPNLFKNRYPKLAGADQIRRVDPEDALCGESCADCGEQLRGYGGWFGSNLAGNEIRIRLFSSAGEGGSKICVFCRAREEPRTNSETK